MCVKDVPSLSKYKTKTPRVPLIVAMIPRISIKQHTETHEDT